MCETMCDVSLSDSLFKPRPPFRVILQSDATGNMSAMEQIERQRRIRHLKFPSLKGRHDIDSFTNSHTDLGFRTYNDEGDHRVPVPYRDFDNIIDPVSGFVSVGGEVDRDTGRTTIKSMVQIPTNPTATVSPQKQNSIRAENSTAPPDIRRLTTLQPGQPSMWNSRQISDSWICSQLGGWTSARDPRTDNKVCLPNTQCIKGGNIESKEKRDHLATRFTYSTSTQSAFEQVEWDELLRPKKWLPTTTLEQSPDPVTLKPRRYAESCEDWQTFAPIWDRFQFRNGYYGNRPTTFCSIAPRSRHIPGYSGSIGGTNLVDIDNAAENFTPLTVKRVAIPRYSDTAHRPDIPKYEGCTLYRGRYAPMHTSSLPDTPQATTAAIYREIPIGPNASRHKKESHLSKTVRTVQPGNPFTREHDPITDDK